MPTFDLTPTSLSLCVWVNGECLCSLLSPSSIERYSVIPLSPNSGLIGWVPHCDTIHSLIREYREKKKIMLNIEHRLMLQVRNQGERVFV